MKRFLSPLALPFVAALLLCGPARGGDVPPLVSVPRFTHPGAGQVFYFVLTDRFANGSAGNDTGGMAGGPDASGFDPTRPTHFHGGDFVGLTSKLDYIRRLGVTAIWITPPFRNRAFDGRSAGYHGYWILDFAHVDPHLGSEAEFREFVAQAHAIGIKVYLDIVVNHTADVIHYRGGATDYLPMESAPYRDSQGRVFDPRTVAYNGVNAPEAFPTLSAATSFPYAPEVAPGDLHARFPEWLNDVTLYHNRGNSTFTGESSTYGDFAGLDDLFTESPAVVRGFIDIYSRWIQLYGIDGYRIDTVKHVNMEFWQAFAPAIRERAAAYGRPDFLVFGEVANMTQNVELMSAFTTTGKLDASLDFGFYVGARNFISRGGDSAALTALFQQDDLYTGPDTSAQAATTFISNHDDGRFGYFLKCDNPGADPKVVAALDLLGQELLLTVRGQPVIYYGDEQGMTGYGNDNGAREDMFPSSTPAYRDLALLGTDRTGKDDKFDEHHPFYRAIAALATERQGHPGLSRGAMLLRPSGSPHVFAFSRIDREERVEFVVAASNARSETSRASLPTCQRPGAGFHLVFSSPSTEEAPAGRLVADAQGRVDILLGPLGLVVYQADAALGAAPGAPSIGISNPAPGSMLTFSADELGSQVIPRRRELRAEVTGGDGLAEVTFVVKRGSRPDQFELAGTADRPPYRVFWRPPADFAPDDTLSVVATVDDLRGHRSSSEVDGLTVAPTPIRFGIQGATVPLLVAEPGAAQAARPGTALALRVSAQGTGPLDYTWLHDGRVVLGATSSELLLSHIGAADGGEYRVLVHNREGTAVSRTAVVRVED